MPMDKTAKEIALFIERTRTPQAAIAAGTGVSTSKICRVLKGKARFTDVEAGAIAQFMRSRSEKTREAVAPPVATAGEPGAAVDAKAIAGQYLEACVRRVAELADSAQSESVQAACAQFIIGLAHGKPAVAVPKRAVSAPTDDKTLLEALEKLTHGQPG